MNKEKSVKTTDKMKTTTHNAKNDTKNSTEPMKSKMTNKHHTTK